MHASGLARALRGLLCSAAVLLLAPHLAAAQTTTGSIRGNVLTPNNAGVADAQVIARDVQTNVQRSATTSPSGHYFMGGLRPATYEISVRRLGYAAQTRTVHVGIGQTLDENFSLAETGVTLSTVAVTAARVETRTSEVATNVTTQQIENLPSPSRNFLDLAQLAPGVSVTEDRINGQGRNFMAGGQSPNAVNLFIDGASFKNDLTGYNGNGGVSGQDASRGNPFGMSAIQEYRVVSQNFKAEYQKSSSAIITATTKSGTNDWHGNLLVTYQNQDMVSLDSFQVADKAANPATFKKPDYKRTLSAFSLGGPIIHDKAFFFVDYEGNFQDRNSRVTFAPIPAGFSALDTVNLPKYQGQFTSPFREPLLFGKVSYSINNNSDMEFNLSNRSERDIRDFGGGISQQTAVDYRQNVTVAQIKHNFYSGPWLNEAHIDFSRFQRNPRPNLLGVPARIFQLPGGDATIGGNFSTQDFRQNRVGLRNDLTYSGYQLKGQHVFKGGASLDFVQYNILKDNDGTPRFIYRDNFNGQAYDYATPYQLFYGTGDPTMKANNQEIGLYVQDDWTPVRPLTLNLGVRWDFETNMLNKDYVTPANVANTLRAVNDSLPTPLDLNKYIATGSNRKPFYGAIQPRLGFSYALDQNNRTTVFGGWGVYYDRVIFDIAVDEKLKITHPNYTVNFAPRGVAPGPGQVAWSDSYLTADKAVLDQLVHSSGLPEAWFINNDIKVPHSNQYNLGVRQLFGDWVTSLTYAGERAVDQVTLAWANFGLNPNGSCCTGFNVGAHGYSNFIYSSNDVKTWYDAVTVQVDRPYQRRTPHAVGWGAGGYFTAAKRELQGVDGLNDEFAFPNPQNIPKHPSNDEKYKLVGNWIVDLPYIWGIQFSGLATFGGKQTFDVGCPVRFCGRGTTGNQYQNGGFTVPGTFPYQNVNLRLRKDFPIRGNSALEGGALGLILDVFNATNSNNFGCYRTGDRNETIAIGGQPVNVFGKPTCVTTDARRYQIGAEYKF